VTFSVFCKDFKADTFLFGDSYVAIIESTAKWTYYYVADGYGGKMLMNAFSGASSADLAGSLANILKIATPRKILWCMGMDDGADADADTPSAAWAAGVADLLAKCTAHNIEPLFVTIPTVPSISNEGKNKWIRNSGYRYADFAKAVGATSAGAWSAGMLAADSVHPTDIGAKAMYSQLMADLPDVFM